MEKQNEKEKSKKKRKEKEIQNETMQKRWTRAQMKTRIRIENCNILKMTASMVDGQVSMVDSIKQQCGSCLTKSSMDHHKKDQGICFVNPVVISPSKREGKSKNIDDASRSVADCLSIRNDNDIILLPYNIGRHWVFPVLDMKLATCYYLDSMRQWFYTLPEVDPARGYTKLVSSSARKY
ncbi:unnamed protein product [Lactuca virosa]|uniref:Ubiquitin-like protease family profile domain-containing protein n=1 Tax=Lactuca virosa TaxID=75947 RepID=A0AAU9M4G7_9ASTR|nr:unnamed protein product [Lactuca virosa]